MERTFMDETFWFLEDLGFVTVAVVLLLIIIVFVRRRSKIALVLTKFSIDLESEHKIHLVGRKAGIMGWIANLLKLETRYELIVSSNAISFIGKSIFGKIVLFAPLSQITSTKGGYQKPLMRLIFGLLLIVSGLAIHGDIMYILIILGLILIISYFFNKLMIIGAETSGSNEFGIAFKRSVIENVDVNIDKVEEVIKSINNLILEQK